MATVALSGIITPSNVVTATSTTTLTNKTLTAPTIASANLTTALTLAGAAGTNGQVLTSAGSGLPTWSSPSSGALTLLSTVTASNSATVDVETTFSSTYDVYLLEISGMVCATDGSDLQCRMKISGAYVATSTYSYHFNSSLASSTTYDPINATATAGIQIAPAQGNVGGEHSRFSIKLSNPSSTSLEKGIQWQGFYLSTSGVIGNALGVGKNTGTGALTGLRFYMSAGNITSGTFRLYGIANS